jgi:hypothetical protein
MPRLCQSRPARARADHTRTLADRVLMTPSIRDAGTAAARGEGCSPGDRGWCHHPVTRGTNASWHHGPFPAHQISDPSWPSARQRKNWPASDQDFRSSSSFYASRCQAGDLVRACSAPTRAMIDQHDDQLLPNPTGWSRKREEFLSLNEPLSCRLYISGPTGERDAECKRQAGCGRRVARGSAPTQV